MATLDALLGPGTTSQQRYRLNRLVESPSGQLPEGVDYFTLRDLLGQQEEDEYATRVANAAMTAAYKASPEYSQKLRMGEAETALKEAEVAKAQMGLGQLRSGVGPEAIKGTPEWARVAKQQFDEEQAGLKQQAEAQKIADKQKGADQYLRDQQVAMERQLADIAGLNVAEFTPQQLEQAYGANAPMAKPTVERLDKAAGFIDAMIPAMTQGKADMEVAVNSLKELGQTFGLQQLRSSGVAPGSVTEREWSKFERMLGTFDLKQDPNNLYNQLRSVYNQLGKARQAMQQEGYSAGSQAAPAVSRGAAVPVRSEQEALQLPAGTRFQLPDGRTGTAR